MKLLVKVYEHPFVKNIITQEIIDSRVFIEEDLRDFGVATFTLPLTTIQEDNYIEIYEINNTDTLIFSWFVYKVQPVRKQFGILNIEARSEKAMMTKRYALVNKSSYNVKSIASLPVFPASAEYNVNYWVNNSLSWVQFLLWLVIPPPPKEWPAPSPYYSRWFIWFNGTTFLIDTTTNLVKRLENWQILNEGTGNGVDINWILDDLIDDYSNSYNENWLYSVDFNENISLNIKQWDNYFDALDELADQTWSVRNIKNNTIIFKKTANDKTQWENFQEILYNWLYPNTWNVANIEVIGTATRCNIVMWQDKNWNITVNNSWYTDRIYGVWKLEFRDGDLYNKTNKAFDDLNRSQRVYQVEVESNSIIADIGDKIKLTIENTNSYFDISSDVIVLWKTTDYNNGSKKISYSFWELNLKVVSDKSLLYWIAKSIKLLKV